MQTDASPNPKQDKPERLTPKELLNKHLKDPNHQITDEELRNLKVGADATDEAEIVKDADAVKNDIDSLPDTDTLPNPYKVLR